MPQGDRHHPGRLPARPDRMASSHHRRASIASHVPRRGGAALSFPREGRTVRPPTPRKISLIARRPAVVVRKSCVRASGRSCQRRRAPDLGGSRGGLLAAPSTLAPPEHHKKHTPRPRSEFRTGFGARLPGASQGDQFVIRTSNDGAECAGTHAPAILLACHHLIPRLYRRRAWSFA